jgi:hypothetical protein
MAEETTVFWVYTGQGFNEYIPDEEKDIEFFPYDYTRVESRIKGIDSNGNAWNCPAGTKEHWVGAVVR